MKARKASREISFVLLLAACFAATDPAAAQAPRDYELCEATAGDPDEAVKACTVIIRNGKHSGVALAIAYSNRGHHFGRKKDTESAIQDFNEALKLAPNRAQAWTNRGAMYARRKEYDRAIADHTRAIELEPNHKDAWYNRGYANVLKGDKTRAIADYRQALKVNPSDEDARTALRALGVNE